MDENVIATLVALAVGAITFSVMFKKQRESDCPS